MSQGITSSLHKSGSGPPRHSRCPVAHGNQYCRRIHPHTKAAEFLQHTLFNESHSLEKKPLRTGNIPTGWSALTRKPVCLSTVEPFGPLTGTLIISLYLQLGGHHRVVTCCYSGGERHYGRLRAVWKPYSGQLPATSSLESPHTRVPR